MCGIVGLFAKTPDVSEHLGEHLGRMLMELGDRGPDSAGVAFYRELYARLTQVGPIESIGMTSHLPMLNFGSTSRRPVFVSVR